MGQRRTKECQSPIDQTLRWLLADRILQRGVEYHEFPTSNVIDKDKKFQDVVTLEDKQTRIIYLAPRGKMHFTLLGVEGYE